MDRTIDMGAWGAVVLTFALAAVFALLSIMFYRGKWLNLIAGNNFVTKEEMQQPSQRELGKKVSICVGLSAVAVAGLFLRAVAEMFDGAALSAVAMVVFAVFGVGALGDVVYLSVWSIRKSSQERRKRLDGARAASSREKAKIEEDVRLERRQAIVIGVIIVAMLVFYLAVFPLAKSAQAS